MKTVLGLFKRSQRTPHPGEGTDSLMFSTAFMDQGLDAGMLVPWDARVRGALAALEQA